MIKNTELLTLLDKTADTLLEQVTLAKSIHELVLNLGGDFEYQELSAYDKFLRNLDRVEKTSIGLYLPKAMTLANEHLKDCQDLDDMAIQLSETNFIIGAFTDQMDEGSEFEETCLIIKSEMEFGRWYQYACSLAGFEGFDEYEKYSEDAEEPDIQEFASEKLIDEVGTLLSSHSLTTQSLSDDDKDELIEEIEDSLFLSKEGSRLVLNAIYFTRPDACKVIDASDFVDGTAETVVEGLSELFSEHVDIRLIDSDNDIDWSDEEQTIELGVEIGGEKLVINYSSDIASDPLKVTDYVISNLADRVSIFKTEILTTRTTYNVWDEDGAALIVRLPSDVKNKIGDILESKSL